MVNDNYIDISKYDKFNSLGDIFENYLILNFKNKRVLDAIDNECLIYLNFMVNNEKELDYFDYDLNIDKEGTKIEIKANNIITALWFIGIFPEKNIKKLNEDNFYVENDVVYKYLPKSKILKIKEL